MSRLVLVTLAVEVPPGWRVATSPALARTGDILRGRFPSLPGDTIGITLQAPTGTLHAVLQVALPLVALLVLAGGGVSLFFLGRARGRRSDDLRRDWPRSLPGCVIWAVAIAVSGGLTAMRSDLAIPEGQSAAHGYGAGFGVVAAVLVALVAIPVGLLIARAGSRRT